MPDLSDAELLARFRAGEEGALQQLLERHEAALFAFLVGMLRDHHQAEDALQDTFVRALEHLDGVDPDHLRGWLFTVAYRQAMLLKRRQRTASSLEEDVLPDREAGPLAKLEEHELIQQVRRLLGQLPPAQQEVIRRRVYGGMKFREIAVELRCPLNTALARMREGLRKLRLLWGDHHD